MDEIEDLLPFEDRARGRRVFDRTTGSYRRAMQDACTLAGTADYSPHDLRHRRASLWLLHGIDPLCASQWTGHSDATLTLDTYGHVIVSGDDEWRDFWVGVYRDERLPREG